MEPMGEAFIPFAKASIGEEEEEAVLKVLRSGWLTSGKECEAFEKEFSQALGYKYALALCSATAGLHLALEALGVKPGDRIITTPYTFASTAGVIRYFGADPVFVDIEEEGLNIDPGQIETTLETLGSEARGIMPVHIAGKPCAMADIERFARSKGVWILEDSAHMVPQQLDASPKGSARVYSFYANKTMTTGEGGMLVTDDEQMATRVGIMRLHGIDRSAWDRYQSNKAKGWFYDIVDSGYKYNLTDLAAAIGRVQLRRVGEFLVRRRNIAHRYIDAFSQYEFLRPPISTNEHAWHLFVLRLELGKIGIDRDDFLRELQNAGIGISVHYRPLHMMSYYRSRYGYKPEDYPRSLAAYLSVMSLPIYPSLTDEQVQFVIDSVVAIGKAHSRRRIYESGRF